MKERVAQEPDILLRALRFLIIDCVAEWEQTRGEKMSDEEKSVYALTLGQGARMALALREDPSVEQVGAYFLNLPEDAVWQTLVRDETEAMTEEMNREKRNGV